jgi:hypothetical protein
MSHVLIAQSIADERVATAERNAEYHRRARERAAFGDVDATASDGSQLLRRLVDRLLPRRGATRPCQGCH